MIQYEKNYIVKSFVFGVLSLLIVFGCAPNYINLGNTYLKSKNYEQALDSFSKAKELQPSNWLAYNRLGSTYFNLKKYDDAIIQFKTANNLKEVSGNFTGLGISYLELGDYKNADAAFSIAFKTTQDDDEKDQIKMFSVNSYVAQGKYQKAYDILGPKPYLGITVSAGDGAINIVNVTKGAPASLADLRSGDILTNFDGNNLEGITPMKFVKEIVRKAEFGSEVIMQIKRGGLYIDKNISVGITPQMAKTETDRKRRHDLVKKEESKTGVRLLTPTIN